MAVSKASIVLEIKKVEEKNDDEKLLLYMITMHVIRELIVRDNWR